MAESSASREARWMLGSKGTINKVEFVRIIMDALESLGYQRTADALQGESKIQMYLPEFKAFRKLVLDGQWDACLEMLDEIGFLDEKMKASATSLISEEKGLESKKQNFQLGSSSKKSAYPNVGAENSRLKLLVELQKSFPPFTLVLPERMLETLVEQALIAQIKACVCHSCSNSSFSLYRDHQCSCDRIICQITQTLKEHAAQVLIVKFSHNGKYLASSSADCSVIIWKVEENGEISLMHKLDGHKKDVVMVAWSPDDSKLVSCGQAEKACCWIVDSGECEMDFEMFSSGTLSCCWAPDGEKFCCRLTDGGFQIWNLSDGTVTKFLCQRVAYCKDIAFVHDSDSVILASEANRLLVLNLKGRQPFEQFPKTAIDERHDITSFTLSTVDYESLLVHLVNREIHLFSFKDTAHPQLVAKYAADEPLLRSCFGGAGQSCIAAGSEDSKVYIWNRKTTLLLGKLNVLCGEVRCVSWNPVDHRMLASASTDGTIQIWRQYSSER